MYILFYSEGCTPHIKEFKLKSQVTDFIKKFQKKAKDNEDNWIDLMIKGDIVETYEGYESLVHE